MTTGVYDRYWHTGGGAERVAAAFAVAARADGEVVLLGPDPIDIDWLEERLGIELAGIGFETVGGEVGAITKASRDLDVLVNASFMSHEPSAAATSLYYVHFPTPLEPPAPLPLRVLRRAVRSDDRRRSAELRWGEGFHHRDAGSRAPMWTDGRGCLDFHAPDGEPFEVRLTFGYHRPTDAPDTDVVVTLDGDVAASVDLTPPGDRVRRAIGREVVVTGRGRGAEPVRLCVESASFVPAELGLSDDRRRLGVPLLGVSVGTRAIRFAGRLLPSLFSTAASRTWLESYDILASNSAFTRDWVQRYWGVGSEVLHPPVTTYEPAAKEPLILAVGRFFPAELGHSKRQLEMVEAFGRLHDRVGGPWRLCLAGGCDPAATSYLDAVRTAAAGLPVDVVVNAPAAELADRYGRASIFWHAAGLGVDARRHPDRLEHFGISTAEAMSAGAVPVVIDLAGQREIVRHGVDGFRFRTLDDLVELTDHLIGDAELLTRFGASSIDRARSFDVTSFERNARRLLDRAVADRDRPDAG